jgi:hypothetical protein
MDGRVGRAAAAVEATSRLAAPGRGCVRNSLTPAGQRLMISLTTVHTVEGGTGEGGAGSGAGE